MHIRSATEEDHADIVKVSKQTKWTKDFTNQMMFSSTAAYERGWIRVAVEDGKIVGFSCFRDKVRQPEVVLYFVGVVESLRGKGIGWALVKDVAARSVHSRMALKCAKDNEGARYFYVAKEFETVAEDETYWTMAKEFPKANKKPPAETRGEGGLDVGKRSARPKPSQAPSFQKR